MQLLGLLGTLLLGSSSLLPLEEPVWVLEALDGTEQRLAVGEPQELDLVASGATFLRVEGVQGSGPRAGGPAQAEVGLTDGGALLGSVAAGDGESLTLILPGGTRAGLELAGIRSVVQRSLFAGTDVTPMAPEQEDRLYLVRSEGLDRVDGLLDSFSATGVRFESVVGLVEYGWPEVAALFVEPLEEPGLPEGAPVDLALVGGGRLQARFVQAGPSGVRLHTVAGVLDVALADLAELTFPDPERFSFLGDLEPSDLGPLNPYDEGEPLGQAWPPRIDQNVEGGPLRVGGRTWLRGIGVHSPSRVTWDLAGGWDRLRCLVGLDDSARVGARRGRARFRVLVDGEVRWESEELEVGGRAVLVPRVDLTGARTLVLEVDPVGDWTLDRANWLRPLLIR